MTPESILKHYGFSGNEVVGFRPDSSLRAIDHSKMLTLGYVLKDGAYYCAEEEQCEIEDLPTETPTSGEEQF